MSEYHKINSVFKRDMQTKRFIEGAWSTPELEYLHDNLWLWDEKIDGTNIRIGWDGVRRQRFIGGKTDSASIPAHLFARLDQMFSPEVLGGAFGDSTDIMLYGEGFGHKIQKGGEYLGQDVDFILFDVKIGRWWLTREAVEDIARQVNCKVTPVIGEGTLPEAIQWVRTGFPSAFGTAKAEGLVLRPKVPLSARSGERIITKVKTRDFS